MAPRKTTSSVSPPPLKRRKIQSPCPASRSDRVTVYSWNVNGIEPLIRRPITSFFQPTGSKQSNRPPSTGLRDVLRRYSWPTMLLLQEVKINPDDKVTQAAVRKAVRRINDDPSEEPSYVVDFCLPSDKYNARGFGRKVYGVCTIIRQDFYDKYVDRVRHVDWDSEGRCLICETRGVDPQPQLAVINIYAVSLGCETSP
jgi:exonuclease III